MNRREKKLLDRQLWAVHPTPPSLMGLALLGVFLSGMIIGSVLFPREKHTPKLVTQDVTGSVTAKKPLAQQADRQ